MHMIVLTSPAFNEVNTLIHYTYVLGITLSIRQPQCITQCITEYSVIIKSRTH